MHQLAQLNIAKAAAPLDSPAMAGFMDNLNRINALAEAAPGFVWRLIGDGNNATDVEHPFGPGFIVNMSVWRDVECLRQFTYKTEHALFIRDRKAWFGDLEGPHQALWWVPADHRPDLAEAKARLGKLAELGPTPEAFVFSRAFKPDGLPLKRGERVA